MAALIALCAAAPAAMAGNAYFVENGRLQAFDGKAKHAVSQASDRTETVFDRRQNPRGDRLLRSKRIDTPSTNPHKPAGQDLWLTDVTGERKVGSNVVRAKLSPAGNEILQVTAEGAVKVTDLYGGTAIEVKGGHDANWKPDGKKIVFAKVPQGRNIHMPGTLELARLDRASGKVELLTAGEFDDTRPQYHPSGEWILFVSGARSGLASFWQIPAEGGNATQVTNVGLNNAQDLKFVPPPYATTLWSQDGRWFLYDYKKENVQQVWGLEFTPAGKLKQAIKLADGLSPQWIEDGKSFAYRSDRNQLITVTLP
jgi:Tol biopolymer transport system component